MIDAAKEDLQKAVYEVSAKLYQQANPQGAQGAAPQGDPQQGTQGGSNGDPNVYDADFKDVDGNWLKTAAYKKIYTMIDFICFSC